MAGTIFGLPLSQPVDINGRPLVGNLTYLYLAGTSTPADSFQDFNLSLILPFPIEADAVGRIPQFWLADGAYRVRLTDANGILIYDIDGVEALGPSTGGATGGGSSIDATSVHQTGDMTWQPITGAKAGWVRANGRTMGSASSGAAERANADTQPLYEFFWNNFSDTLCPVTGGRGGSAVVDFTANKSIGIYSMRGRGMMGLDDMGGTAAGIITAGTPTVAASTGGAEKASITIAQANLPSFNLDLTSATVATTSTLTWDRQVSVSGSHNTATGGGQSTVEGISKTTASVAATGTLGGTIPSGGSGTALTPTTISPYVLGSFYWKL